jgi:hypothetical protein
MRRRTWIAVAVTAVSTTALLAPGALAGRNPLDAAPGGHLESESGEGVAPGTPARIVQEQIAGMRRSAAGREWLQTAEGKEWLAEATRYAKVGRPAKTKVARKSGLRLAASDPGEPDPQPNYYAECADFYDEQCYNNPDGWYEHEDEAGADPWNYWGGCKTPYKVIRFKNKFGHVLWRQYQQVHFCWNGGILTHTQGWKFIWRSDHWLNGWNFHGWTGQNCGDPCWDYFVGASGGSMWGQGRWEWCSIYGITYCRNKYPLTGIEFNGWGGWRGIHW